MFTNEKFTEEETTPERGVDGLLDELNRQGTDDDVAFLGALESRLDSIDRLDAEREEPDRRNWRGIVLRAAAAIAIFGTASVAYWQFVQNTSSDLSREQRVAANTAGDDYEVFREISLGASSPTSKDPSIPSSPVSGLSASSAEGEVLIASNGKEKSSVVPTSAVAAVEWGEALSAGTDSAPDDWVSAAVASNESVRGESIAAPRLSIPQSEGRRDATRARKATTTKGKVEENEALVTAGNLAKRRFGDLYRKNRGSRVTTIGNRSKPMATEYDSRAYSKAMESRVRYPALVDNVFKSPESDPLSTFSIDVDTASYSNVRRIIESGQTVPSDAVRIEELINYFDYNYPAPGEELPFSVNLESAACPWKPEHRLVRVGLKGQEIHHTERQALNLVFLIDVSGSMNQERKLPLVQQCLHLLIDQLREDDTIAIVTYAGREGVALASTSGAQKQAMHAAVDRLRSTGGTNGEAGVKLAYRMAFENFSKGGVNRILLATDGDFNIGVSSTEGVRDLVKSEAQRGIFLSVLGFGSDNLNDAMLETITNDGNGTYHYIDGVSEGRRVLVEDLTSTMITIAKDVKIQVEFNPSTVGAYRLIGYANRMLPPEAFNNDRIDAGDIGAGHTVTAFYEIAPPGTAVPVADDLKYQTSAKPEPRQLVPTGSSELLTVKLRYKAPDGTESKLIQVPFTDNAKPFQQASNDFRFGASVAAFGMHLRNSQYDGSLTLSQIAAIAIGASGTDSDRKKFVEMIGNARSPGGR